MSTFGGFLFFEFSVLYFPTCKFDLSPQKMTTITHSSPLVLICLKSITSDRHSNNNLEI